MSDKREVRPIDANALCAILEAKADMALVPEYKHAFLNVQAMVNAMPTLDVIPMDAHRKCMEAEIKKRVLTEKTNRRILENYGPSERTSLNDMRDAIYEDAVAHGLWDKYKYYPATDCVNFIRDEVIELEYAAMNWRNGYEENSELYPEFCHELADVIIMSLSVAGKLGIDIDAAVRSKMEINKARPWKHGEEERENENPHSL